MEKRVGKARRASSTLIAPQVAGQTSDGAAAVRLQEASLLATLSAEERDLIRRIHEALSFDLLNDTMRDVVEPTEHYCRGHCYVAAEAFYYLYGQAHRFEPRGRDYHWWLEHPKRGVIAEPTGPQHSDPFDYSSHKNGRFMPQTPKRASRELIRRVRAVLETPRKKW
jgi:hypothetical protein